MSRCRTGVYVYIHVHVYEIVDQLPWDLIKGLPRLMMPLTRRVSRKQRVQILRQDHSDVFA